MPVAEAADRWNALLSAFPEPSPFQTFENGAVASAGGWDPQYWLCGSDDEKAHTIVLALVRRLPFSTGAVWIVGGPAGDFAAFGRSLLEALCRDNGFKRCYLRARIDMEFDEELGATLRKQGIRPAMLKVMSGMTAELDLTEDFAKGLSNNWKRSLKKAVKSELVVNRWMNVDPRALRDLFESLEDEKRLEVLFTENRLASLAEMPGLNLQFHRCDDKDGNLLAVRAQMILGERAVDYLAVSSPRGRELCASHLIVDEVRRRFSAEGIKKFELGGIDPVNNPGVTRFKLGTGARKVVQFGEVDIATSELLRLIANVSIKAQHFMEASSIGRFLKKFRMNSSGRSASPVAMQATKGVETC